MDHKEDVLNNAVTAIPTLSSKYWAPAMPVLPLKLSQCLLSFSNDGKEFSVTDESTNEVLVSGKKNELANVSTFDLLVKGSLSESAAVLRCTADKQYKLFGVSDEAAEEDDDMRGERASLEIEFDIRAREPIGTSVVVTPGQAIDSVHLSGRSPVWNDALGRFELHFSGRAHRSSLKNFQLIMEIAGGAGGVPWRADEDGPAGQVVLLLGRRKDDAFNMDFCYPLNAMQAAAVALARIDATMSFSKQ